MKLASILFLALIIAVPAMANDLKVPNDSDTPGTRVECDVTGCTFFGGGSGWSGDAMGPVVLGPLGTDCNGNINNVVLSIDIVQTWIGDLNIHLYYDADNDGVYDAGPVQALCRPNLDGCPWDGCCGCSGDVQGVYTFGDDGAAPMGEPDCPSFIPTGCYMPAVESASFGTTFGGQPAGGSFYLEIGDGAGGDPTTLNSWGVHVCCGVTPTEESNWGSIKSTY